MEVEKGRRKRRKNRERDVRYRELCVLSHFFHCCVLVPSLGARACVRVCERVDVRVTSTRGFPFAATAAAATVATAAAAAAAAGRRQRSESEKK